MNKTFIPRKHNIFRRNTKRYDKKKFLSDFLEINWNEILTTEDTNLSFNSFFNNFNSLLDKHIIVILLLLFKILDQKFIPLIQIFISI